MIHFLRDKKGLDVSTEDASYRMSRGVGENHVDFYTSEYIKNTKNLSPKRRNLAYPHR